MYIYYLVYKTNSDNLKFLLKFEKLTPISL